MSIFFANPKSGFKDKKSKILKKISTFIDSGDYVLGPEVRAFENKFNQFLNNKGHFVSCANGTDAITLALLAHDISSGYVITPSHTAPASVLGIMNAGCEPLFVDVDSDTALISIAAIEKKLQSEANIKAILAVHLYGNGIDIPALVKVSRPYDCVVIEDCAQSAGTEIYNKSSGTLAQAGTYSFFPTKNLPALGDGGGVWIPSKKLKQKIESLRQYGWDNKRIVTVPNGMNSRLDELQAVILQIRLKDLKKDILRRRKIAALYNSQLSNYFQRFLYPSFQVCSFHLYVVKVQHRSKLMNYMKEHDIFLGIHYTPPNHQNGLLKKFSASLPITEKITQEVVSLPIHPELNLATHKKIIKILNSFETTLK
ncbi:DegT/DnrJ/EryC1/StrS family aminotransferase [Gammaproteobacteria bacterium]|jgi:dTDP-4-amino-4,6-dideoxygalactose transaminase|nr:DegT/DnrJ/EryC1/StrS family aminotransferase [Gammaproteobacteria bacterium]